MIISKEDLMEYVKADNKWLIPVTIKEKVIECVASYPSRSLRKYLRYLRKQEYYINSANGSKWKGLLAIYYEGKKNRLGNRLGIEIGPNCFGKGLNIYHSGSIIVNPAVRAGANCSLHGANCIGNNGLTEDVPTLGSGVDIGYGAVVIGKIVIADGVKIGANALVNCSVMEPGCTVAGVPAKIVKYADKSDIPCHYGGELL